MGGIFGLIVFIIMLIRHAGACARDSYHDMYLRDDAINKGYGTYFAHDGERMTISNHRARRILDNKYGAIEKDLVTGKEYYPELKPLMEQFHREKDQTSGSMWKGYMGTYPVFVDKKSEWICALACAAPNYDTEHTNNERVLTWFYVDYFNQTTIVKKTDAQIAKESDPDKLKAPAYSIEELKTYKDKTAYNTYGVKCRDKEGKWKIQTYENQVAFF